ncbi:zinc finger, CCHC-type containing protein [Tanacetum coccineum]
MVFMKLNLSNSYANESSIYTVSNKRAKLDLDSALLWHCRLGHISKKRIEKLQHDGLLNSTDLRAFEKYVPCMSGKMARKPYTHQVERAKDLLGLIHTDGCWLIYLRVANLLGFKQKSGIDYFDTYAPVARISTIRLLIAMASIHNMIIHQMDVKTSFLNGDLDEEVYMNQPQGLIMHGNENKVCKLIKPLYGLKQAPKQWHQKFDEVVLSNGYLLNQADKCVYSKFDESGKGAIICLYVDDILIFVTNQVHADLTKKFLSSRFSMKDMGEDDVIIGIRIKHEISTPMDRSEKLMHNNGQAVSQLEYSKGIGCLMYAMTCARPGIAFVVGKLSRLMYSGYPLVLEGYTDASWISNTKDNSSTSGWVFLLSGGAVSGASKKQTCIISSTMGSEFVALAAASKEAEWLKNLLFEIPLWVQDPIASTPISIPAVIELATLAKAYSQM